MTKTSYLFLMSLLLTFSLSAVGQGLNPQRSEQEIRFLLTHKWFFDSVQVGNEKISAESAGEGRAFIHLRRDGTFSDASKLLEGVAFNNKWYYNHKTKSITMAGEVVKVLSIDEKRLMYSMVMDGKRIIAFLKREN